MLKQQRTALYWPVSVDSSQRYGYSRHTAVLNQATPPCYDWLVVCWWCVPLLWHTQVLTVDDKRHKDVSQTPTITRQHKHNRQVHDYLIQIIVFRESSTWLPVPFLWCYLFHVPVTQLCVEPRSNGGRGTSTRTINQVMAERNMSLRSLVPHFTCSVV